MSLLQEIEDRLAQLSRAEKVQLFQLVAQDIGETFSGVESNPGIMGGDPCIVGTRIPIWLLEQARRVRRQ